MRGQINDTAQLYGNGKTLLVTGWVQFDADEQSAIMEVTVSQGASRVKGKSGDTPRNKKAWTAEITTRGRATFLPGPARAVVTATVKLNDGTTEQYPEAGGQPWERYITLVG